MASVNPHSFHHRCERLSTGNTYHFIDELPSAFDPQTSNTILCIHGFPDLWFGWRHQIAPWRDAGYRVVVPDMLGYGQTDKPDDTAAYTLKSLSNDLAALLDKINVVKAFVVGHDWGAATVWRFALYFPERVLGLVTLLIPYIPPAPTYLPLEKVVELFPDFGYQLYFADDHSTKEIEEHLDVFLAILHAKPRGMPRFTRIGQLRDLLLSTNADEAIAGSVLSKEDHKAYIDSLSEGGMRGPLSYYKTTERRFEEERECKLPAKLSSSFPVLFIWGSKDASCSSSMVKKSHKFIPSLREIKLEGVGHWLMVEAEERVTSEVLRFLEECLIPHAKL